MNFSIENGKAQDILWMASWACSVQLLSTDKRCFLFELIISCKIDTKGKINMGKKVQSYVPWENWKPTHLNWYRNEFFFSSQTKLFSWNWKRKLIVHVKLWIGTSNANMLHLCLMYTYHLTPKSYGYLHVTSIHYILHLTYII